MAVVLGSSKTKIAKRVIEVLEYFDDDHRTATVMDIVRRYGRPQSSTSELLSTLVEVGLLYKEPRSRSYWPTPRLAVMGARAQPATVRNGHLFEFMDDLARSTRLSLALFGIVGVHVQIFHWAPSPDLDPDEVRRGSSELLSASAAGQLLLSTMDADQVPRVLRRINAEAAEGARFSVAEMGDRVATFGRDGHATGPSGFLPGNLVTATLFPSADDERPLALGFVYREDAAIDTQALLGTLSRGIAGCDLRTSDPVPTPPFMIAV